MGGNLRHAVPKHEQMVRHLVASFLARGYQIIAADCPGYNPPGQIGRHRPDVLARHGNHFLIGEAKTTEELDSARTEEQIADYTGFKDATLVLCLPAECRHLTSYTYILMGCFIQGAEILYHPDPRQRDLAESL